MLCQTCILYPRLVNQIGMRVELSAALSCPDIAKLCLLAEDATEIVKLDLKILPQGHASYTTVQLPNNDPFLNYVNVVRHTIFKLMSLQQYSVSMRLFFCVYFANKTLPFFYQKTTTFSEDELFKEIARINDPELLDTLYNKFNTMEFPNNLSISIIEPILVSNIRHALETDFAQLALACLRSYQAIGDITDDGVVLLVTQEELWDAYEKRRSYWEASAFGERIDLYFSNYYRNHWINYPYVFSTDLLSYFSLMLAHYAILRFLFFSHPELASLQKTLQDTSVEGSIASGILDKIIVNTTYMYVRHIAHNLFFAEDMNNHLNEVGIKSFAHMVFLIKF